MSERTNIEWADSTFNPWMGCAKVSPACDHCYAERDTARFGRVEWGAGKARVRTSEANWRKALLWNARSFWQCTECGWRGDAPRADHADEEAAGGTTITCPTCSHGNLRPARRRVFCASLADVFDNEVDPQWRADLFDLILRTPNLDWLLLTKRIGNVRCMLPPTVNSFAEVFPNVWLGATICTQAEADRDIPKLLSTPAAVRFLSIEPMLGPVDLRLQRLAEWNALAARLGQEHAATALHWVICGGESGPNARPSSPDWFRSLRDQCSLAGVPFLFKQWGEWIPMLGQMQGVPVKLAKERTLDGWVMGWAGKKAAGRLLDGRTHTEYPNR